MNNAILKNILVILSFGTLAFGGYYLYSQRDASVLSIDKELEYQNMLLNTQVFIEHRQELSNVEIDTSFFEDGRFRSLQSNTKDLRQVEVGRTDPFARAAGS